MGGSAMMPAAREGAETMGSSSLTGMGSFLRFNYLGARGGPFAFLFSLLRNRWFCPHYATQHASGEGDLAECTADHNKDRIEEVPEDSGAKRAELEQVLGKRE
jgi:hypothetical protein